jgi:hypothetical protein
LVGNCIHRAAQTVSTSHAPTIFSYSPAHDTSYKFLITTYEQPIRHNPKRKITVIIIIIIMMMMMMMMMMIIIIIIIIIIMVVVVVVVVVVIRIVVVVVMVMVVVVMMMMMMMMIIIIIIIIHYVQYCHVLGCGLSLFTLVIYTVSFLSAHQQSPLKSQEFLRKFLINSSLS